MSDHCISGEEEVCIPGHMPRTISLLGFCTGLALAFLGLFEWDVPLTRFVRTLYHPVGYLPNPWLAQFSDIGDLLGKGETLVALSLLMLVAGVMLKQAAWRSAGWQSLLAHGIAALIGNAVKHLLGRPRPKFMHAGNVDFSPAGGSGWDSFPSGHATASFAVAAVLAVRFPKVRWVVVGIASAIALSRILRGSHFLTDTVGGAVLGWFVGMLVAHPWRDWRSSLTSALYAVTPLLTAFFALTWTIGHRTPDAWPGPQLVGSGILLTLVGLAGHVMQTVGTKRASVWFSESLAQGLIGLGLGMATGSVLVTAAVLCVCLAHWLRWRNIHVHMPIGKRVSPQALTREAVFSLLILLGLIAIFELRGLLPVK